jgi:hypothetical protein
LSGLFVCKSLLSGYRRVRAWRLLLCGNRIELFNRTALGQVCGFSDVTGDRVTYSAPKSLAVRRALFDVFARLPSSAAYLQHRQESPRLGV